MGQDISWKVKGKPHDLNHDLTFSAHTLIRVVTSSGEFPHNVVAIVFTAADSFFRISPYCRIDNFFSGVTHNAGSFLVPQIVGWFYV